MDVRCRDGTPTSRTDRGRRLPRDEPRQRPRRAFPGWVRLQGLPPDPRPRMHALRARGLRVCTPTEPLPPAHSDEAREHRCRHAAPERFVRPAVNSRYERDGHVFQGPYRAQIVRRPSIFWRPSATSPSTPTRPASALIFASGPGRATPRSSVSNQPHAGFVSTSFSSSSRRLGHARTSYSPSS